MTARLRRRWSAGRRGVLVGAAGVAVGALLLAACGNGSPTAKGSGSGSTTTTASQAAGSSTTASTSGPSTSSASAAAQNLAATAAVKSALMAAFLAHNGLPADQIAGTAPNSVYYGYLPSTNTYWAIAGFVPVSNASYTTDVAMQDEGCCGIFTMSAGGSWTFAGSYLGEPCAGQIPAAIMTLWQLPKGDPDCPTTTTTS